MGLVTALRPVELVAKSPLDDDLDVGNAHAPIIGELPDQVGDGRIFRSVLGPVVELVIIGVVLAHKALKGWAGRDAIRSGIAAPRSPSKNERFRTPFPSGMAILPLNQRPERLQMRSYGPTQTFGLAGFRRPN